MLNPALLPDGPGAVRLHDLGDPGAPGGDMVRVRMARTPINPADLLAIDGAYAFPVDPDWPLGAEGVGHVDAVGPIVADLSPGDMVMPLDRGNWCAWRLVARSRLIRLPCGIDVGQAAMARINPATAWLMLDALGVPAGGTIVQNAAGSAVASWVRAFAAHRGISVIDVARRPAADGRNVDDDDLAERVRDAAPIPVSGALDCVAGTASGRLAACLAPGGRMLVFGHLSGAPVTIASHLLTGKQLTVSGFSLRPAETAAGPDGAKRMFDGIVAALPSVAPLPVGPLFGFGDAVDALAAARAGGRGRVQFVPAISGM